MKISRLILTLTTVIIFITACQNPVASNLSFHENNEPEDFTHPLVSSPPEAPIITEQPISLLSESSGYVTPGTGVLPGVDVPDQTPGLLDPLEDILDFMPPLAPIAESEGIFHRYFLKYTRVCIYRLSDGVPASEPEVFFDSENIRSEKLRLGNGENDFFIVNWHTKTTTGKGSFRIEIEVTGQKIGFLDIEVSRRGAWKSSGEKGNRMNTGRGNGSTRTIPIKIRIEESAELSIRIMLSEGNSPVEMAHELKNHFNYTAEQTTYLLTYLDLSAVEIASALKEVYQKTSLETSLLLASVNFSVLDIGMAIKEIYLMNDIDIIMILTAVGYTPEDIGTVLISVYGNSPVHTAFAFFSNHFSPEAVGLVLRNVYVIDASTAAVCLQNAGYSFREIAIGMRDAYDLTASQTSEIILGIGASVRLIVELICVGSDILEPLYNVSLTVMTTILGNIGVNPQFIADAIVSVGQLTIEEAVIIFEACSLFIAQETAAAFKGAFPGLISEEFMGFIFSAYQWTGEQAVQAFTIMNEVFGDPAETSSAVLTGIIGLSIESASDVAVGLRDVYGLGAEATAFILKGVGFGIEAIVSVLKVVFDVTVEIALAILEVLEYGIEAIIEALTPIYELGAEVVGELLNIAGYGIDVVAHIITLQFGYIEEDLANILASAGFALEAIGDFFVDIWDGFIDLFDGWF